MTPRYATVDPERQHIFNKIIQYAKEENLPALNEIVHQGYASLNIFCVNKSIMRVLVEEDQHVAINFLVQNFQLLAPAICHYTAVGNDARAEELINKGISYSTNALAIGYAHVNNINKLSKLSFQDDNIIRVLAWCKHKDSVDRMLAKNLNLTASAIRGYARGEHYSEVYNLIKDNESNLSFLNAAAGGFAQAGRIDCVEELLKKNNLIDIANIVSGYLSSGYLASAKNLFSRYNGSRSVNSISTTQLCKEYAEEHYPTEIQAMVNSFTLPDILKALQLSYNFHTLKHIATKNNVSISNLTFDIGNHYYLKFQTNLSEWFCQKLASIDNDEIREKYFAAIQINEPDLDHRQIWESALKLRRIMETYQLNYWEANAIKTKGVLDWLLLGMYLVYEDKLPFEIFMHISSKLTRLNVRSVEKLQKKLNSGLLDSSIFSVRGKYSEPELSEKIEALKENYSRRLIA